MPSDPPTPMTAETAPAETRESSTLQPTCRICGLDSERVRPVFGRYSERYYDLARCDHCGYAFVVDPWLDYGNIYNDDYYAGEGPDPLVDYRFELEHPDRTIRCYEWQGIARLVTELCGDITKKRWLDYGSGNGGLVRHLRDHHATDAIGFEHGSIAEQARARGIPVVEETELHALEGSFDIVTAVEVLEHTYDPISELRRMRRLLRPGGLLFLTTGNARPHADHLADWSYIIPEIHISFFEPRTLERAMKQAGFYPEQRNLGRGLDEILMFKVLKNLRLRRRSIVTDILPRRIAGLIANSLAHLDEHPIGWAEDAMSDHATSDGGPHSRLLQ